MFGFEQNREIFFREIFPLYGIMFFPVSYVLVPFPLLFPSDVEERAFFMCHWQEQRRIRSRETKTTTLSGTYVCPTPVPLTATATVFLICCVLALSSIFYCTMHYCTYLHVCACTAWCLLLYRTVWQCNLEEFSEQFTVCTTLSIAVVCGTVLP